MIVIATSAEALIDETDTLHKVFSWVDSSSHTPLCGDKQQRVLACYGDEGSLLMVLRIMRAGIGGLCVLATFIAVAGSDYAVSLDEMLQAAAEVKGQAHATVHRETAEISSSPKAKKQPLPELHHVVGVPLAKAMRPKEKIRLGDKQELICASCHGLEKIDETPIEQVDKQATNFLLGGPYETLTDFCYRCHSEKTNQRPNIHAMVDEQGKIREQHCTYCHEKPLKRDQIYSAAELKLRVPREVICYGCHLKTTHLNALQHQVKPSKEKLQQLKETEKKLGISLPLSDDGKVMCVTCHSPHPNGVLKPDLAAAKQVANQDLKTGISYAQHPWGAVYAEDKQQRLQALEHQTGHLQALEYQRIKTEVLLRLPAKEGSLCLACHTFTDRQ